MDIFNVIHSDQAVAESSQIDGFLAETFSDYYLKNVQKVDRFLCGAQPTVLMFQKGVDIDSMDVRYILTRLRNKNPSPILEDYEEYKTAEVVLLPTLPKFGFIYQGKQYQLNMFHGKPTMSLWVEDILDFVSGESTPEDDFLNYKYQEVIF